MSKIDKMGRWFLLILLMTSMQMVHGNCLFPEAITPNGDDVNDEFKIICLEGQDGIHLWIFNRWGTEVYADENYQHNWDGTSKGDPLTAGTYFYVIEYTDPDTRERTRGEGQITIQR